MLLRCLGRERLVRSRTGEIWGDDVRVGRGRKSGIGIGVAIGFGMGVGVRRKD